MAHTGYQSGTLKKVKTKHGMVWKLRYFAHRSTDGKWVEQTPLLVGTVQDFPNERRARDEAVRLGLVEQINRNNVPVCKATFGLIARDYMRVALADDAVKPKGFNTRNTERGIIQKHLLARWEQEVAVEMKPLAIEQWLKSVSVDAIEHGQEWESLTKWRRLMKDVFLHGQKHELIPDSCNPMEKVKVKASSSNYVPVILTPKDTFSIFNMLPLLQQTMVLLDAVTGLRYSEIAGLRWKDVDWEDKSIQIQRRWIRNNIDAPKTKASKAPVVMSDILAAYLLAWRQQTTYSKVEDWIFASVRTKGATPRVGNMLVRDYLYPAAVKAGVLAESKKHETWIDRKTGKAMEGERTVYFDRKGERVKRFGFHQFRHSLSSFLTTKKKVDPKTAQTTLRQSNAAFTLSRYTQTDTDELMAAQQMMVDAIFGASGNAIQ